MITAPRRLVWVATCAGLLVVLASTAPLVFRRVDIFRVRRVEVAGVRFLTATDVVKAAGITDSANVFDRADVWIEALAGHALISDVRIERRPPATLRFHVREAVPIVLAPLPELRPVDAHGRLLPIAPAGIDLDLPVLAHRSKLGADSIIDGVSLQLVRAFVTLRALDPALAARVSEIGAARGGGVQLTLAEPAGTVLLLPGLPDARGLHQLRLAMEHLQSTQPIPFDTGGTRAHDDARAPRPVRIDARYRDELFVTLQPRRPS